MAGGIKASNLVFNKERFQCFGSQADRGLHPGRSRIRKSKDALGPGQYNLTFPGSFGAMARTTARPVMPRPRPPHGARRRAQTADEKKKPAAFSATAPRFNNRRYHKAIPGPGRYTNPPSFSDELARKNRIVGKREAPFGTAKSAERFDRRDQKIAAEMPGPGSYAKEFVHDPKKKVVKEGVEAEDIHKEIRDTTSSNFKSAVPRLAQRATTPVPGPGQYFAGGLPSTLEVGDNKFKSVFMPSPLPRGWTPAQRDEGLKSYMDLGPGTYYTPPVATQGILRPDTSAASSSLRSETTRFTTPVSYWNQTPGPGSYHMNAKSYFSDTDTF